MLPRKLLSLISILAIAAAPAAGPAGAEEPPPSLDMAVKFPVEKYALPNGLTIILHPDATIPAVSLHTWFRVGSKDENAGRTGLAHFFEHMMFKGTPKFQKQIWGQFLKSKGADFNAFTSTDYTGYFINAPSDQLELLLQIESDRMRNLILDPKEVDSEREVVKEERRVRNDDSVEGGIDERMASLMFEKLPYRWLQIGSMVDLNAASMEDLRAFYKQFYSPGNAVLVLAGAFDPAGAKKLIETYYGKLAREKINRPSITPEPVQKAMRKAVIEREAQAPTVAIAYRLPDLNNPDNYALDLLSMILGQGNSSRLYKDLVYKREIAIGVVAGVWERTLAGEFMVSASLKPKISADMAIAAIENQVKRLRASPVTQKELEKARNQIMKEYVDELKRVSGRARILAHYEVMYGDYSRVFTDLKKYQGVTVKDLSRVAKTYLGPEKRNIVIVLPRKRSRQMAPSNKQGLQKPRPNQEGRQKPLPNNPGGKK